MSEPTKFFASYSRADKAYVEPVVELLRSGASQVFMDVDHLRPGDQWRVVLEKNLEDASTLLVFWSRNSRKSEAVAKEWHDAKAANKRIIPIRLDNTALPEELSAYQYIDFRHFRRQSPWIPLLWGTPFAAGFAWLFVQTLLASQGVAYSIDPSSGSGPTIKSFPASGARETDYFWPGLIVALGILAVAVPLALYLRRRKIRKTQSLELAKGIAQNLETSTAPGT